MKIQKKNSGGGGRRVGGQGGCERRSKVFVKIQKKKDLRGPIRGWGGGGGGSKRGGVGLGGGGVRVDVNGEVKLL